MSEEEYRTRVIGGLVALLRGEGGEEHLEALVRERDRLAKELEFEAAARLRDLIAGIERIRLTRTLVSAEGVQAVVASSTEPGMFEVFAFSEGRLVAHKGFEPEDAAGLTLFTEDVLGDRDGTTLPGGKGTDEARVVAAYLRRRKVDVEVVPLRAAAELVSVVRRVAERAAGAVAGGDGLSGDMIK
jgi:excinuclease UvrABC nuclease subunit